MIELIRLGGHLIVVNAELIETVEETPDTVVTLTTGKRFVVRDDIGEILEKVIAYKQKVYSSSSVTGIRPSGGKGQAVATGVEGAGVEEAELEEAELEEAEQ